MVDAFYLRVARSRRCRGAAIAWSDRLRAAAEDRPEASSSACCAPGLTSRNPGEDLRAYFSCTDDESLRAQHPGFNGTYIPAAVERDPAPVGAGRHAPGE